MRPGEDWGGPQLCGGVSLLSRGGCSPSHWGFDPPPAPAGPWLLLGLDQFMALVGGRGRPGPGPQAPSPRGRAGRDPCSPPPASPALALGAGLQLAASCCSSGLLFWQALSTDSRPLETPQREAQDYTQAQRESAFFSERKGGILSTNPVSSQSFEGLQERQAKGPGHAAGTNGLVNPGRGVSAALGSAAGGAQRR